MLVYEMQNGSYKMLTFGGAKTIIDKTCSGIVAVQPQDVSYCSIDLINGQNTNDFEITQQSI